MRKLVVGTFLTLDGVMQAPGGPDEDRDGGFENGGWSVKYWDDMMGKLIVEQTLQADALLLGRKTYEIFAAHWPRVTDPKDPVAAKLNSMRKYVASRTLRKAEWQNASLLRGDAGAAVARLKEQAGGEIHVTGSSNLIQTLLNHDLIDEFRLWVFPVSVGSGKRLFGAGTLPGALRLVDTKVSTTGVVIHRYERAGKLEPGTFEVDKQGRSAALWEEKS
ncbi:MAG: dihydrofolate reductase [Chloroflexi bacterium]|nr:MAG: dihydrofolate reductase [Chloroflexota bacterium]